MINLSSERFLQALLLIFFGAVGLDISCILFGIDRNTGRVGIYLISAILLFLLLYFRLRQNSQNRMWAIFGLVPPLGILFGLYLYLSGAGLREGHDRDR